MSLAAFRWGRMAVVDLAFVEAEIAKAKAVRRSSRLKQHRSCPQRPAPSSTRSAPRVKSSAWSKSACPS
jgi:hypothetical protein